MKSCVVTPANVAELIAAVQAHPKVLAIGAGTKPRLSSVSEDFTRISTLGLSGIVEYQPDEFTFTAMAGTRVRDIAATLRERGQYLPFDPVFLSAGSTLGGCVAAGLSGPGRFRFGGIRDFILGVRFVDGSGRLLRLGGKVVKNAAGFDVPKFFVGSLGRFGVLVEMTFKVFPRPASTLTLAVSCANYQASAAILTEAATRRWELDAIEVPFAGDRIVLRLAGPAQANETIAREILSVWRGEIIGPLEAEILWKDFGEFGWAFQDGPLIKVAMTPEKIAPLMEILQRIENARVHLGCAGNVAYVALPTAEKIPCLDEALKIQRLAGVTLRGDAPLWLGLQNRTKISRAIKSALDPQQRFPSLED